MADILKITTPLISKNTNMVIKHATDPTLPFNIQDLSKVIKPNAQSELQQQNNGLLKQDEPAEILLNMLKDPTVTMNFLKNIFLLEEIIHLLPVNNHAVTQEIQQLFDALLVKPEKIISELNRQAIATTNFQGGLFDVLRELANNTANQAIKFAIADVLRALNNHYTQQEILTSLGNNFAYLAKALAASPSLSKSLSQLAEGFRQEDAIEQFNQLKNTSLGLISTVSDSILLSPKIARNLAIIRYNLSRFNDNPNYLTEVIEKLTQLLDKDQIQSQVLPKIHELLLEAQESSQIQGKDSQVMSALTMLIDKSRAEADLTFINSGKFEKIIQSLLSSPCNFTPLMHFVIPVQHENLKSFAEIWIDPNETADQSTNERNMRLLLVFDIVDVGVFEAEMMVNQRYIDLQLLCPGKYIDEFAGMTKSLRNLLKDSIYQFNNISIGEFKKLRSLIEVFKTLPDRRTGINVKA